MDAIYLGAGMMGVPSHEAHKLTNTFEENRLASLGNILIQVEENKTLFVVHNPLGQRLFYFQKFKSI